MTILSAFGYIYMASAGILLTFYLCLLFLPHIRDALQMMVDDATEGEWNIPVDWLLLIASILPVINTYLLLCYIKDINKLFK